MAVNFSFNCICFVQVANTVTLRIKTQYFRKYFYNMSLGFGKYCLFSETLFSKMLFFVTFRATIGQTKNTSQLNCTIFVTWKSIFSKRHIFNLQRKSVHEAHFLRPLIGASLLVSNNVIKTKKNPTPLSNLIQVEFSFGCREAWTMIWLTSCDLNPGIKGILSFFSTEKALNLHTVDVKNKLMQQGIEHFSSVCRRAVLERWLLEAVVASARQHWCFLTRPRRERSSGSSKWVIWEAGTAGTADLLSCLSAEGRTVITMRWPKKSFAHIGYLLKIWNIGRGEGYIS